VAHRLGVRSSWKSSAELGDLDLAEAPTATGAGV
jgi:hypothetical protein